MEKTILNCDCCGGRLEISKEFDVFICDFCRTQYLINRSDKTRSIESPTEKYSEQEIYIRQIDALYSEVNRITETVMVIGVNNAKKPEMFFELNQHESEIQDIFKEISSLVTKYKNSGGEDYSTINIISPFALLEEIKKI